MSETLAFKEFSPTKHNVYEIGDGVVPEMALAFDCELAEEPTVDGLRSLIGAIGPAKELQQNIEQAQQALGTDEDATTLARGWAERSGLLVPVDRSYMNPETSIGVVNKFSAAVITGGVRNWMRRRAERLISADRNVVSDVLLVAGSREMREAEGPDVEAGMTEADYMDSVVRSLLDQAGLRVELVRVDSMVGDEVMDAAAKEMGRDDSVLVASNAGAWVQNAGQLRRAMTRIYPKADQEGDQLYVVSDSFELGTGQEPITTHQNPFSALGQIARNAQELQRHQV